MDILESIRPYEIPLLLLALAVGAVLFQVALRRRSKSENPGLKGFPGVDGTDTLLRIGAVGFIAFALNSLTDIGGKLSLHVPERLYSGLRMILVFFWVGASIALLGWIERKLARRLVKDFPRVHTPGMGEHGGK